MIAFFIACAGALPGAHGIAHRGASSEDAPSLISASATTLSAVSPCPPGLPWGCATGATQLTLTGSLFGSAPGAGGGVDLAAAVASPAPAPTTGNPFDLPDALSMDPETPPPAEFAWAAASGGCLRPSDAASADFSFEVCPYGTSYLRARGGGARVASLGAFAGVVRRYEVACDDPPGTGLLAVTGLLFQGGDACGAGTRSAQVNFVCSSAADPWEDRYSTNTTVHAATASADGCAWQLDVPLASACFEDESLCSGVANPSPNPSPAPAPFTFSSAFVAAWAPGSITVLAPPATGVRAARVRRYDGAVTALVAPLPAPLPPSASPIPAPFPAQLMVLGATPAAGLSFAQGEPLPPGFSSDPPCLNGIVVISLGGVQPSDLEGFEAGFEVSFPRNLGQRVPSPLYGAPLGANATVTRVPANGRLDLLLDCAPFLLDGFPTPYAGEFTVQSRYFASPTSATKITRRTAVCAPGACTWTFWGPVAPAPSLTGSLFGSAPGAGGGVDLAAAVASPAPAPTTGNPFDLPDALSMDPETPPPAEFAWAAASGGCLRPSDAASADFSFEVCPYGTSYLRARGGGARVASLGAFAGVVRRYEVACDDPPGTGLLAVTGLLFQGGDACGAGTRSAQVNFVCSSAADPWEDRYSTNTTVHAATASADGCAWQLDVPLASACFEDESLCSGVANPSPNPSPAPAPFTFSSAFVAAWAPGSITVLAPPATGVRAARVRRYDGAVTALVAPLPAPLPPSASPIPAPFPAQLMVLGATPAAGLSFAQGEPLPPGFSSDPPCLNGIVVISLGGVQPSDLEGFEAGFEVSFPRNLGQRVPSPLYGAPLGANATVTRVPANGRLDLLLDCAPFLLDGFPTPYAGEFTVQSRYFASPTSATKITRRTAVCAPGACTWTFWGPVAPAPSSGGAAAAALAGPALYGAIGGGVAGFLALVAAGVAAYCGCWAKRCGKGASPAPSPPRAAWAPNAAIEMNPVAVALNAPLKADGSAPVQEWGGK